MERKHWSIEMVFYFLRVEKHNYCNDLCLDLANDRLRCISRNNLGIVQHVEFLGGIATRIQKDSLLASRVVGQELKSTSSNFYGSNEMNGILTLVTSRT